MTRPMSAALLLATCAALAWAWSVRRRLTRLEQVWWEARLDADEGEG